MYPITKKVGNTTIIIETPSARTDEEKQKVKDALTEACRRAYVNTLASKNTNTNR